MSGPGIGEVAALLYRYARAVDSHDWELYRSVFTADAHIDYGAEVVAGSRDEVVDWMAGNFSAIPMSMHYITNVEILTVADDAATVRAMFFNPMTLPGMAELSSCGGYYHHTLVRTPDGWRSRELREEMLWFANPPAHGSATPLPGE
ncbi:MAG: nuclear transport factor 2 family protein [Mycobacterium sp.]